MASDTTRLAVLIDADNTSSSYTSDLLEELAKYGTPTVRRAYGDWTTQHLVRWKTQLLQHAIQPVQQFSYTTGKNSTDSALIIDAMDLLYAGNVEGFAIVSSDSDFTRLATRLRESGMVVYGLGMRKTPRPLVEACDRFIFLEVLGDQEAGVEAEEESDDEPAPPLPDLRRLLTNAVQSTSQDDGWSNLGAVGSQIGRSNPSFDPRNYGFAKLVELARAQSFVDVERDDHGLVRVRLRSSRPTKKQAAKKQPAKTSKAQAGG